MHNITKQLRNAFYRKGNYNESNSIVYTNEQSLITYMYLHENEIAREKDGVITFSDGGYGPSKTTRERLRGLMIPVTIKNGEWYLEGEKWDGKETERKKRMLALNISTIS